jgi:Regulator of G protein signaling domain
MATASSSNTALYLIALTALCACLCVLWDCRLHYLILLVNATLICSTFGQTCWSGAGSSGNRRIHTYVAVEEGQRKQWSERWNSCTVIMREPVMDAAFGQLIQKFLCYESYAFLKEVDQYEKEVMGSSSLKQHSTFNTIVAKYLVPGSPQEVNISNTMRSGILK